MSEKRRAAVIGADGVRSTVREQLLPQAQRLQATEKGRYGAADGPFTRIIASSTCRFAKESDDAEMSGTVLGIDLRMFCIASG